jgi:hypothetical protein
MVEQVFSTRFTDEDYAECAKKLDPALDSRRGAWRRSSLSLDRLRLTCEFEAPDAESVRQAMDTAGMKYERIWAASVFAIEDYPERMEKLKELLHGKT